MKFKSTLSLLCVTGLMAMALAGCGSGSAGTASAVRAASNSANTSSSSESSSSEIIGQVQSVSDKTVTLLLGELTDAGQNQDGAPAEPAGSSSSSASLNSSPDTLQAPSNGQPGAGKTFTAGTETVDITITDDTAIKVESVSGETDGSIDDVKEGAVLDVTLDDNNIATSVIIKNGMAGNLAAPDDAGTTMPAGSSSGSQSSNN